jgi:hypothetical protein
MEDRPLCCVLAPFGIAKDAASGAVLDFDAIYDRAIRPGIEAAGLHPVRADGERTGGVLHRAAFERLLLCDFAVADLTAANANVFYELGVRHALRPGTTLAIVPAHGPADVPDPTALPYVRAEPDRASAAAIARLQAAITERLHELRAPDRQTVVADNPLFQLLTSVQLPDVARLKTDVFRDQVRYSTRVKQRLEEARRAQDVALLAQIERDLGDLDAVETGVLVDLLLSYRAVSAHDRMVDLFHRLPAALQRTVLVREQLGFALNRLKRPTDALDVLQQVLDEQGPSSETLALMGRIHKDLWSEAKQHGDPLARNHLDSAIALYVRGFESDWRDAYPGINAVTLLDIRGDGPSETKKQELLPVVRFAVLQRVRASGSDYWDYATLLELAVLASDEAATRRALGEALAAIREPWEARSTANNLTLIREARAARGVAEGWLGEAIAALESAGVPAAR